MRKLLYFPIVHSQTDMGSLGSELLLESEKKYGKQIWLKHLKDVEKSWNEIEIEIFKRIKNFDKIKIYQDGLPVIGEIGMKIVKDIADKGSKNYQIIEKLINLGAKIEIAENKEYLLKEYHLLSDINKSVNTENKYKSYLIYQELSRKLLNDRDNYISNQINTTLKNGETGIAFFGAIHSIIDKLNDIKIYQVQKFKDDISLNLIK